MHNAAFDITYVTLAISVLVTLIVGTFAGWTLVVGRSTSVSSSRLRQHDWLLAALGRMILLMVTAMFSSMYVLFIAVICSQSSLLGKHRQLVTLVICMLIAALVAWIMCIRLKPSSRYQ
jgi:hypothetical protein